MTTPRNEPGKHGKHARVEETRLNRANGAGSLAVRVGLVNGVPARAVSLIAVLSMVDWLSTGLGARGVVNKREENVQIRH